MKFLAVALLSSFASGSPTEPPTGSPTLATNRRVLKGEDGVAKRRAQQSRRKTTQSSMVAKRVEQLDYIGEGACTNNGVLVRTKCSPDISFDDLDSAVDCVTKCAELPLDSDGLIGVEYYIWGFCSCMVNNDIFASDEENCCKYSQDGIPEDCVAHGASGCDHGETFVTDGPWSSDEDSNSICYQFVHVTGSPTGSPTLAPTGSPTLAPKGSPTLAPTGSPTTGSPTGSPTLAPTGSPTQAVREQAEISGAIAVIATKDEVLGNLVEFEQDLKDIVCPKEADECDVSILAVDGAPVPSNTRALRASPREDVAHLALSPAVPPRTRRRALEEGISFEFTMLVTRICAQSCPFDAAQVLQLYNSASHELQAAIDGGESLAGFPITGGGVDLDDLAQSFDDLKWYPSGGSNWPNGYCELSANDHLGRHGQGHASNLECCKGSYGGQMSANCMSEMGSAPTLSPTPEGGLAVYYPDYDVAWSLASCVNTYPLPSGRPTYTSLLACCKGAYIGQMSGACLAALDSPPTTSPTSEGGAAFFYPDYNNAWSDATCKNDRPVPFGPGGRPTYDTMLECCKGAYAGQTSGKCLSQLDNPPTLSPTSMGGLDVYYPDYSSAWTVASCLNTGPIPSGRPTYTSLLACCKGAYGGQASGACIAKLDSPPTTSPTSEGGADFFYPDYDTAWSVATCKNERPLPYTEGGRPTYATMLECCKRAYGGQTSGKCIGNLDHAPTSSPTSSAGLGVYYPNYLKAWPEGVCINTGPKPSGRPEYDGQDKCCENAYRGQVSDVCMCDVNPCYSCKCGGNCPYLKCDD